MFQPGDRVVTAVSGGADSLAMLYVLDRLSREYAFLPLQLHVAHLDHGLRGEQGKGDANFVRNQSRKLGLSFTIARVDAEMYRRGKGLSLEDAARQLRYRFLAQVAEKVQADKIAVGHNRDDQVETVLLNFLRGSGLGGLSGMKARRRLGQGACDLVRPLLGSSRREIDCFCRQLKLNPRIDATNQELQFRRNRVRLELIPYLEEKYNPRAREAINRLSQALARDNELLENLAAEQLEKLTLERDENFLSLDLPRFCQEHQALQARIIRLAASILIGAFPRDLGFQHIQEVIELCCGKTAGAELHLPRGLRVFRRGNRAVLALSTGRGKPGPVSFAPAALPVPGQCNIPETGKRVTAKQADLQDLNWPPDPEKEAYLDYARVASLVNGSLEQKKSNGPGADHCLELLVRPRQEGDRFYPLGAPGSKKLKDYFIDHKIPLEKRGCIPLVTAGQAIIWVAGYQVSELCRITGETSNVLVLQLEDASAEQADTEP